MYFYPVFNPSSHSLFGSPPGESSTPLILISTLPSMFHTPQVPPGRVLVISDDLDQPTAGVKLKQKGGHGGHNGLRSIIERMGNTQEFPRIKVRPGVFGDDWGGGVSKALTSSFHSRFVLSALLALSFFHTAPPPLPQDRHRASRRGTSCRLVRAAGLQQEGEGGD